MHFPTERKTPVDCNIGNALLELDDQVTAFEGGLVHQRVGGDNARAMEKAVDWFACTRPTVLRAFIELAGSAGGMGME